MSYLGKAKKEDLRLLAEELGAETSTALRMFDLKNLILNSREYDEEFVKEVLSTIINERIRKEEREQESQQREKQREQESQQREKQREHESQEREKEREFQLKKMQIEAEEKSKNHAVEFKGKYKLENFIQKFDVKKNDISLYLTLFERQVRKANLKEADWVYYLLGLLPVDISQIIAREPEDKAEDYQHIKSLLLKRFKLTPEKFRLLFVRHQKNPDQTWLDFIYELRNYFEEWIKGMEVTSFDTLVDLMVTDQVKRRVSGDVREHFIDDWPMICSSTELGEKLEKYEIIRQDTKNKTTRQNVPSWKGKSTNWASQKKELSSASKDGAGTSKNSQHEESFEKRKRLQCYKCGSYSHLRPQCPELKKGETSSAVVNHIIDIPEEEALSPYISHGKVNGCDMPILRDTGATIDLICQKYISPEMLTGENVWVQQPLDEGPTCLPLARVELDCVFGQICTKAAVIGRSIDQGRYLLGNRTAALLIKKGQDQSHEICRLSAVQEVSQNRLTEETNLRHQNEEELLKDSYLEIDENFELPKVNVEEDALSLLQVNSEEFSDAQKESNDLKPLFNLVNRSSMIEDPMNECFIIKNKLLVKRKIDKTGLEKYLLVVPEKFRERLKVLCHEDTSAHLGVTKTKDALSKHFFWPKCYQEIEDYVRSCDQCQRAGKPNDKKKAPMKLVPVIQEVFSKINVDAVGPLPTTHNGNKYIITAMCLSSKYPDAVAVSDIKSASVIDALLQVFSRMGFPKEIQFDQGTSFMSNLTTEFLKRFGIKVTNSSIYHPQSNPIERFHRTIKRILRVLCLEAAPDWEQHIHSALFALRTVTHESTGFTPAELVHGRNLRTPLTLLFENWMTPSDEETEGSVVEYVFKLINRLKRSQEIAIKKMEEVQIKRKLWYDKNAVKREFKEGDLVLIFATSKLNKLSEQWIGPGTVESKISDTNYIVSIPGRKEDRSQIYHINMLKPYYKRPEIVNFLACSETTDHTDLEIEFPILESDPNIFNFGSIVQENQLEYRLESHQIQQLQDLLRRYWKSFSNEPGMTHLVEHDIKLINDKPIRAKPYRMSPRQNGILSTEIKKMLRMKIIESGESDYTSPMILVETANKDPRPCIDYRRLNEVIRTEYYPLPNIEQRVETVALAKYITVLDLAKGYWQIPLSQNAQRLAAFVTNFGTYRPLRLPFGLKNAPYFFSKMMAELLQGFEEFAVPYLDDVAVFSNTWEEHLKHLENVLCRIQRANLNIKPSKCKFAQKHVKYLGHIIGQGTRTPTEIKVKAILDFPTPTNKTEIRAFLGLAGYYQRYIFMYSTIAAPLTDCLKGKDKKGKIIWTDECETAFQELKTKLSSYPILYAPDFNREFILQTDASDYGLGIVLSQIDEDGNEHPVLYLSKKFSEVEKRYCTT
ncbi:MAG: RNase H-like domain-containing protein, partial [Nitrososphaeraceae archaeon]|nr:RNase H-like domain-containing protein [Nitrososphaeraceae archaeon]